jgi:hypothetical protein
LEVGKAQLFAHRPAAGQWSPNRRLELTGGAFGKRRRFAYALAGSASVALGFKDEDLSRTGAESAA